MTKGELIKFLEPFDDSIEIRGDHHPYYTPKLIYRPNYGGRAPAIIIDFTSKMEESDAKYYAAKRNNTKV